MGSGLFPTYVYSEKYGKVPKYIVKRAEEMALAKQVIMIYPIFYFNFVIKCKYYGQSKTKN